MGIFMYKDLNANIESQKRITKNKNNPENVVLCLDASSVADSIDEECVQKDIKLSDLEIPSGLNFNDLTLSIILSQDRSKIVCVVLSHKKIEAGDANGK